MRPARRLSRSERRLLVASPVIWLIVLVAPLVSSPDYALFIQGNWWIQGVLLLSTSSMGYDWGTQMVDLKRGH